MIRKRERTTPVTVVEVLVVEDSPTQAQHLARLLAASRAGV
jgi:PleD family two-component response regulator